MKFLRVLGFLNALPVTMVSLVVTAILGVRLAFMNDKLAIVAYTRRGWLLDRIFKARQTWGLTLGCLTIIDYGVYTNADLFKQVESHELVHVKQYMVLGAFFLPLYGLASLFAVMTGMDYYWDNWFEVKARKESGF